MRDRYRELASKLFNVEEEAVTPEQRYKAKLEAYKAAYAGVVTDGEGTPTYRLRLYAATNGD